MQTTPHSHSVGFPGNGPNDGMRVKMQLRRCPCPIQPCQIVVLKPCANDFAMPCLA